MVATMRFAQDGQAIGQHTYSGQDQQRGNKTVYR
jgi:hypothetical protein